MGAIAPVLGSKPVHPHPLLPVQPANSHHLNSQVDLLALLKSAHPLPTLKLLHAHIIKTGLSRNDLIFGQLFLCCSLSNAMHLARHIFDAIPGPKLFFYNAMLKGYSENGAHVDALRLYTLMRDRSVRCDSFTFPAVLRSSSALGDVRVERKMQGLALKMGSGSMLIVQTALVDAYCSCGLAAHARRVFDRIAEKDIICWNTMLGGYVMCGELAGAKELFDEMPARNISWWNTIVDVYCKIGDVQTARNLFDEMPDRDLISWNAVISGCAKLGDVEEPARNLFNLMPKRNLVS